MSSIMNMYELRRAHMTYMFPSPTCGPHSHLLLHSLQSVWHTCHRRMDPSEVDPVRHNLKPHLLVAAAETETRPFETPPDWNDRNTHGSHSPHSQFGGILVISHTKANITGRVSFHLLSLAFPLPRNPRPPSPGPMRVSADGPPPPHSRLRWHLRRLHIPTDSPR
jgi:hypothetical protein